MLLSTSRAGAFGKLPSHADFVSVPQGPTASYFERWLCDAFGERGTLGDSAQAIGVQSGARPIRFLYAAPGDEGGAGDVLVGSLVESQDRVGRRFPFALYRSVWAKGCRERFAFGVPALEAQLASDLVWVSPHAADALERVVSAPDVPPARSEAFEARARRNCAETSERLLQRPENATAMEQVNLVFQEAMQCIVQPNVPGMLVCPCHSPGDVWFWLESARQSRSAYSLPLAIWSDARLLLPWGHARGGRAFDIGSLGPERATRRGQDASVWDLSDLCPKPEATGDQHTRGIGLEPGC